MKIDTMHSQGTTTVLIGLGTEQERSYGDEQLARIALSQDRLDWPEPLEPVAYVGGAKLRQLPRGFAYTVSRLGVSANIEFAAA